MTRWIYRDGELLAALVLDRSLEDEHELVAAVIAAAGMHLENGRMHVDLRARLTELRESRLRLLEAGRRERARLERALHDGAEQRLEALTIELALLDRQVTEPDVRQELAHARSQLSASLEDLRDVARGIYPAVLTAHGLPVALESLAGRSPVPALLTVDVEGPVPEPVAVAAYYVVSESLANVGKHARATSVSVRARTVAGSILVQVADDGVGGADAAGGSGLHGLGDRIEALGGHLDVHSPVGAGTRLTAEIPCR